MDVCAEAFDASRIDPSVAAINEKLIQLCKNEFNTKQKWWDIGAQAYRDKRAAGLTAFPKPVILKHRTHEVASREAGRTVPVRVMGEGDESAAKGIFIHIHGGGWVLSSAESQDPYLTSLAKQTGLLVLSVEYRLAPENPSPCPEQDCFDVFEAILNGTDGILPAQSPARKHIFAGGESAGGHLTMVTALAIKEKLGKTLSGVVLNYGCFDLSGTPSAKRATVPLVLNYEDISQFVKAFVPNGKTSDDLRDPAVSPLYAELDTNLPPALFQCGTVDCLLDDTLFMSARYLASGNHAETKLYPGAPHGATTMMGKQAEEMIVAMSEFVLRYI